MALYLTKEISDLTDEYFAVLNNDREYYDMVQEALTHRFDYGRVMSMMQKICDRARYRGHVGGANRKPNRIQLYLMMAASSDRIFDVNKDIYEYGLKHGYLIIKDDDKPQQPEEVTTVEFSTVHYINDEDIEKLSDDRIIDYIKQEKGRIKTLQDLDVDSTNINSKLQKHHDNVTRLVSILDSRTVK